MHRHHANTDECLRQQHLPHLQKSIGQESTHYESWPSKPAMLPCFLQAKHIQAFNKNVAWPSLTQPAPCPDCGWGQFESSSALPHQSMTKLQYCNAWSLSSAQEPHVTLS